MLYNSEDYLLLYSIDNFEYFYIFKILLLILIDKFDEKILNEF